MITGQNGQGKSSLLEALGLVATSRSFRTEQLKDVIQAGETVGFSTGVVGDDELLRTQRVAVGPRGRRMAIDDKIVTRVADYATRIPVVVFCPNDLELVSGPAALRRTLLDRVSYYQDPCGLEGRKAYLEAARERQRLLLEQGVRSRGLEAYESIMARHGADWTRARINTATALVASLSQVFLELAPTSLALSARLATAGVEDPIAFQNELVGRRSQDLARGKATFGPQRDDLDLVLDGRPARRHASQGQQRLLALSLKLAEYHCIRDIRQAHPILLLDDVASELDSSRTERILHWLLAGSSQVFLTTTAPELLGKLEPPGAGYSHFRVDQGLVRRA